MGSPASALRDAYALYYPAEEGTAAQPGTGREKGAGMAHRVGVTKPSSLSSPGLVPTTVRES